VKIVQQRIQKRQGSKETEETYQESCAKSFTEEKRVQYTHNLCDNAEGRKGRRREEEKLVISRYTVNRCGRSQLGQILAYFPSLGKISKDRTILLQEAPEKAFGIIRVTESTRRTAARAEE
jgi:hypothetical protein